MDITSIRFVCRLLSCESESLRCDALHWSLTPLLCAVLPCRRSVHTILSPLIPLVASFSSHRMHRPLLSTVFLATHSFICKLHFKSDSSSSRSTAALSRSSRVDRSIRLDLERK